MLQPTEKWQWQFEPTIDRLLLDIDPTMAFTTAYESKLLIGDVQSGQPFNAEDADFYQQTVALLNEMNEWTTVQMVQIALNAVAVRRFYKPTMPKSWFFKSNHQIGLTGVVAATAVFQLFTESDGGRFLTIEVNEKASVGMLLDDQLVLNDNRTMAQFEVIKVMNDRRFPVQEVRQLKTA